MTPTFVLVPGAFSNSFGFAPLQRELALRGYRGLAVDLPGRGYAARIPLAYQAPQDLAALAGTPSGLTGANRAANVEHVIGVVRRVAEHGPVILVGHSAAGVILTGVANAVPELLGRLVYISAWCCADKTAMEYVQGPENAASEIPATFAAAAANPAELGAIRMNYRTADPAALAALKSALLADGTDDELLGYLNTLEPDEAMLAPSDEEKIRPQVWGRVPHSYIRLVDDRSLPLAMQDRLIADADKLTPDNPFDIHSIESSHAGFLVHPDQTADILAGLAAS
ncbi:MAG TPA: alpha/beta hydrolase [Pseudonocardiaceae bacterium]|nr:alpha/beta hydrolase [Pseudonocardiaceae bacterium]